MGVRRGVRAAVAVTAMSLAIGVAPTVDAGTYPPKPPGVTITLPVEDDGSVYIEPGQSFPLRLCCFEPGTYVTFTISADGEVSSLAEPMTSGPLLVQPDGSVTWMVPGLPKGTFTVVVDANGTIFQFTLTVGTRIPPAGSDVAPLLRTGLLLVGTGVAIAVVAKRRRPAPVSTSA